MELGVRAGALSRRASSTSTALPQKVKQPMVCHLGRSKGSLQLFPSVKCGDASLRMFRLSE